jgi:hypothetical protein
MPSQPQVNFWWLFLLKEFLQDKSCSLRTRGRSYSPANSTLRIGIMSEYTDPADIMIVPGVREASSEDGAVLLDVRQGVCFSLNPVGVKIWELLKERRSLEQIADALAEEYPSASRPQLLADAREFLQILDAKRLVCRRGEYPGERGSRYTRVLSSVVRRFRSGKRHP